MHASVSPLPPDEGRPPSRPPAVPESWHLAELLGEDVLAEVGRLVLSAISLEDVVYVVCRSVKPRHAPGEDPPIGPRIQQALNDLAAECPEGPQRSRAEEWLAEARDALADRNAVLHAVPSTADPFDPESTQLLIHVPKDKTKPATATPLTVEALQRITARLKAAREGWKEISLEPFPSYPTRTM